MPTKNCLFVLLFVLFLSPFLGVPAYGQDSTAFNPTTVAVEAKGSGGVPVGTIVAWPVATNPSDWDNWLECNGQAIDPAVYPELYALMGANVPDLRGRVLQEQDSTHAVATAIEAGLPNITGSFGINTGALRRFNGAVYGMYYQSNESQGQGDGGYTQAYFNASKSNPIYGKANTVQPPAYAVRYLIRALP